MKQIFHPFQELDAFFNKNVAPIKTIPKVMSNLPSMVTVSPKPRVHKPKFTHHTIDPELVRKLCPIVSTESMSTNSRSGIERILGEK